MPRTAHWYFDYISPFAYLQFQRLDELAPLEPVLTPVLFAGLLKHHGQLGPAEIPEKRAFTYRFATWSARRARVPFRFPPAHPFNPLAPLRLTIAAGSTKDAVRSVFHCIWGEGKDPVADWGALCHSVGLSEPEANRRVADAEVKDTLRRNTEQAIADGAFGVPTLIVDGTCFWGVDATDMAADYLVDSTAFEDDEMRRVSNLPAAVERPR